MKNEKFIWPDHWDRVDNVVWVAESSHSKAGRIQIGGSSNFVKIYGLIGEENFSSRVQVEGLISDIASYRNQLNSFGVITPSLLDYSIICGDESSYQLYMLEVDAGDSLLNVLDKQNWAGFTTHLRQIGSIFSKLWRNSSNGHLAVGIDPKLSNFVIDNEGNLVYVDLMWPLNYAALTKIHLDIRPVWEFRYFTKLGSVLNWFIQATRYNIDSIDLVVKEISDWLKDEGEMQVLSQFERLPGIKPLEKGALIFKDIPEWNVDLFRSLGIRILASGLSQQENYLEWLFSMTRTNPHEQFPKQKITDLKNNLIRIIF